MEEEEMEAGIQSVDSLSRWSIYTTVWNLAVTNIFSFMSFVFNVVIYNAQHSYWCWNTWCHWPSKATEEGTWETSIPGNLSVYTSCALVNSQYNPHFCYLVCVGSWRKRRKDCSWYIARNNSYVSIFFLFINNNYAYTCFCMCSFTVVITLMIYGWPLDGMYIFSNFWSDSFLGNSYVVGTQDKTGAKRVRLMS